MPPPLDTPEIQGRELPGQHFQYEEKTGRAEPTTWIKVFLSNSFVCHGKNTTAYRWTQ